MATKQEELELEWWNSLSTYVLQEMIEDKEDEIKELGSAEIKELDHMNQSASEIILRRAHLLNDLLRIRTVMLKR